MNIDKARLKELKKDAFTHSKKFLRLKEPRVKGCFWHCTQDGVMHCIIRYTYEGINKVYFVTEIGSRLGQVELQAALTMAKVVAEDVQKGGDPQSTYKAEKQAKREREGVVRGGGNKYHPLVREKAAEYFNYNASMPSTKVNIRLALDEVILAFGHKRITEVTKQDVIDLLSGLESRGAEGNFSVASNVQKTGRAMWNWGLDIGGFKEGTPNFFAILATIRKRQKSKKKGRIMGLTETKEMAEVHFDEFPSMHRRCILLQAYTAVRPASVTSASRLKEGGSKLPIDWSEFDLDAGVWRIPKERMKGREYEHIIDMPNQLLEHLKIWHRQDGYPVSGLVTRTTRRGGGVMTTGNLASSYRKRNLDYTPHSWRANIATEIAEMEGAGKEIADLILAHYVGDNYIHTTRRDERKKWLQAWADKLDTLGFDRILMEAKMTGQNIRVAK